MNWIRRNAIGVAAAVLAVATIANGVISATQFVDVRASFQRVGTLEEILDHLDNFMEAIRDAEIGQQGYALTGRAGYLRTYREGLQATREQLARLAASDVESAQRRRIAQLQSFAQVKLQQLAGGDAGGDAMSGLRKVADDFEADERARLARRSRQAEQVVVRAILTTLLSTVTVAVLLAVTFAQIARTTKAERVARLEADSLSRAKDRVIATASHELRTPLTAILGWSRLLEEDHDDGGLLAEGIRAIQSSALAEKQLVDDLLDVSRITTGKMRLRTQPISLSDAARAGVDAVRPAADAKSIRLALDLHEDVRVNADFDRIQQVVWNLVSNAVKFTPKEGVVRVTVARDASHAAIVVSDSGEGIEPGFLPHVFEPFRQSDVSKAHVHRGLGLGLSIVKEIVQLHGGTISVESAGAGKGATFRVNLPIMPFAGDVEDELARGPALANREALHGLAILVIDDHPPTLDLLRRVLGRSGAVVYTAADSAQALAVAARKSVDVIVSDIGLPDENGLTLLQRLRGAADAFRPAVALTAYARDDDRRSALDHGFQAFLSKPVEPALLVSTIAEIAALAVVAKR